MSTAVWRAVIDSSGNAGASLAAYCARAGIVCEVYAPAALAFERGLHAPVALDVGETAAEGIRCAPVR
jgi:hypothetical protein